MRRRGQTVCPLAHVHAPQQAPTLASPGVPRVPGTGSNPECQTLGKSHFTQWKLPDSGAGFPTLGGLHRLPLLRDRLSSDKGQRLQMRRPRGTSDPALSLARTLPPKMSSIRGGCRRLTAQMVISTLTAPVPTVTYWTS